MENIYHVMGIAAAPTEKAQSLADGLVENRLAACVQVIPSIKSTYWWKGKIEHEEESLLLIKTEQSKTRGIRDFLKKHHPYEVPEFIILPVTDGNPSFLGWISESISGDIQSNTE